MSRTDYRHIGDKDSTVDFYRRITVHSYSLYCVLLGAAFLLFLSSFFIKVDVGVTAPGILKPSGERVILTAPFEGQLSSAVLEGNLHVEKGDTLFSLETDKLDAARAEMSARCRETDTLLADLRSLLSGRGESGMKSAYYKAECRLFHALLSELKTKSGVERKNYERYEKLYENRLVSLSEFERYESAYWNACYEEASFRSEKRADWERRAVELERESRGLREQLSQLGISASESFVLAPFDAVVLNVFNVKDGQYVHPGQPIVELSPEGRLLAECAVKSSDVGLLTPGQYARIRVDAFNYNDWGVLEGKVLEVYDDASVSSEGSVYKVYCSLDRTYMELKNGFRRDLKKGMTVSVRFVVVRRNVFGLVFERLDDWLNPEVVC